MTTSSMIVKLLGCIALTRAAHIICMTVVEGMWFLGMARFKRERSFTKLLAILTLMSI